MYLCSEKYEVRRRVSFDNITKITRSLQSGEFIVHVPSTYDFWFTGPQRSKLCRVLRANGPHITITDSKLVSLSSLVQHKKRKSLSGNGNATMDEKTLTVPPPPRLAVICTFDKLTDKRAHTRAELVTTEQSYCESLVKFLHTYAYPLDAERNTKSILQKRSKWIDIFDNFENIVRFHCDFFCPDLQACVSDAATIKPPPETWGKGVVVAPMASMKTLPPLEDARSGALEGKAGGDIGVAFHRRVQLLKTVYEPYLANWTKLQDKIKDLQKKSKYAKFFQKTQSANEGMGINAYLIMPIQRVPRYVLLIKELVKHTTEDHPEYASLQKALKSIQKIAKSCDSYIR